MLDTTSGWLASLQDLSNGWLAALGVLGMLLLALTLIVAPRLIAGLPADHFAVDRRAALKRGPARLALMLLANALALVALVLGLVMLITPGPGVVMLVIALSLADFPGRYRLVQWLVARPAVFDALNWLRHRSARPPFRHPYASRSIGPSSPNDDEPPPPDPGSRPNAGPGPHRDLRLVTLILGGTLAMHAPGPASAQVDEERGTPVPESPSADSVADELARTTERLQQLDAALAESQVRREALAARLEADASKAAERSARVDDLQADIVRFSDSLEALERQVDRERAALDGRRERLADALRGLQRVQGPGPLAVLLQHEDPVLADRLSVWSGYALRAQRRQIIAQAEQLARVEAARARTLKDRNWVEHLKNKASGQRDARLSETAASRDAVETIDSRITDTTRSVATLRADSERLQSLLEALRAAEGARSGYFAAGKGQWPMPVSGRVDARFGERKSVGRLVWNGLFIRAETGRSVSAIADGEVVYADWLTGFGLLAIVDHGDGWMSLYGSNQELLVPVGTWVESGATIATTGQSGGQTNSGLYFEIRQDARPVDPEPWLSGIG